MFFDDSVTRSKVKIRSIALLLATSMFFLGATLANADDIFLQIEGVQGESVDEEFDGAVDVLGWSWGMAQSGSMLEGGSRSAGRVAVQDLSFTHYLDAVTPRLMQYCATGEHIPNMRLTVRMPGRERPHSYLVIDLENVLISKIATGGAGSAGRPVEEVSLNFASFQFTYTGMDSKGGAAASIEFGFDIAANTVM